MPVRWGIAVVKLSGAGIAFIGVPVQAGIALCVANRDQIIHQRAASPSTARGFGQKQVFKLAIRCRHPR